MFNFTIIKMELKRAWKGLLVWTLAIGITLFLIIILYPMVKDIYALIPAELQSIMESFGGIPDNVLEYFATEGAMMMQIFASIFAVMLGFNSITKEEREHSSDAVFSLPVSRSEFFWNKLYAAMIQVLAFSVGVFIFNVIGFLAVEPTVNLTDFVVFSLLFTLMLLMMDILGMAMGAALRGNVKNMVSLLIPFPLYILALISQLTNNEWLKKLKYLTIFTFSDPIVLLKGGAPIEYVNMIIYGTLTILALIYAHNRFKNREFLI
jgi:ABC-2 type transport system permease protein